MNVFNVMLRGDALYKQHFKHFPVSTFCKRENNDKKNISFILRRWVSAMVGGFVNKY